MTNVSERLLCATDLSSQTLAVDAASLRLAQGLGMKLDLLYVDRSLTRYSQYYVDSYGVMPPDMGALRQEELEAADEALLKQRLEGIGAQAEDHVGTAVAFGSPVNAIVQHALAKNPPYSALVLAKKNRSALSKFFLGSVSRNIVAHAPLPTLLLPTHVPLGFTQGLRICLCTSLEAGSLTAEIRAVDWARRLGAELDIVHVMEGAEEFAEVPLPQNSRDASSSYKELGLLYALEIDRRKRSFSDRVNDLSERLGRPARGIFLSGSVTEQLMNQVQQLSYGLVVVGTHARQENSVMDRLARMLGSTAETLAHSLNMPLLIVPHR